jgi:hypothetical protein
VIVWKRRFKAGSLPGTASYTRYSNNAIAQMLLRPKI